MLGHKCAIILVGQKQRKSNSKLQNQMKNDDTPYLLSSQLNVFVLLCKLVFFHKNMYLLVLCLACTVVSCNYYALGPLKRTRTDYSPLNLIYTTSNNALSSSDSYMVANFCQTYSSTYTFFGQVQVLRSCLILLFCSRLKYI